MEDHKKLKVVQDFLAEVYGDEKPPMFEVNSMTVNKLYELALKRQKAIKEDTIILEYNQIIAKESAIEAAQLANRLKCFGYPIENLPPATAAQVQGLAEIGSHLNLKDFKLSSFLMALTELQQRIQTLIEESAQVKAARDAMVARMKDALSLLGEVQQSKSTLGSTFEEQQKQALAKFAANQQYLGSKRAEYEAKIVELKAHLASLGVTPAIAHAALVEKGDEVERLSKELDPKSKVLQTFLDLPPDETLARKKITEARQRLAQLEQLLARGIGDLQL